MSEDTAQKPLILIADDNLEMRRLVKMSLSPLDAEFMEARDGEEALTLIIQEKPALVVLDVMMPELTGWEILKYVREKEEYASTKVVMLTAIGATVNEMTAPLYGADAHLDKPFDVNELKDIVAGLIA
ncbi:MAG: response regulator [Bradymonadia bacterium]